MPKDGKAPKRSASCSLEARWKPLKPAANTPTSRRVRRDARQKEKGKLKLSLEKDGIEYSHSVIPLLSQQTASVASTSENKIVKEDLMPTRAEDLVQIVGTQLRKTVSNISQNSEDMWAHFPEEDLEVDHFELEPGSSNPPGPSCSSVNTPSNSTPLTSYSSSNSSLGKRKAEMVENPSIASDPSKLKASRPIEDVSNPMGPNFSAPSMLPADLSSPVIIASDQSFQKFANKQKICFGAQWQIAVLVSRGEKSYMEIDLSYLEGIRGQSNADAAPKVKDVVLGVKTMKQPEPTQFGAAVEDERAAKSPWSELDREFKERSNNEMAGLGFATDSWYGGKVHFSAKVKEVSGKLKITLEEPTLGPSSRFPRRFGSHAFIRVSVKKKNLGQTAKHLQSFFLRPFVLMNRVYRAVYSKENTVFLFLTNERVVNGRLEPPEFGFDHDYYDGVMSLLEFLNWHNPLHLNDGQAVAKWAARFALGFSNSVPGCKLRLEHFISLPDESSPDWDGEGKLPAEFDMTDGNGLANAALLQRIREQLDWDEFPSTIQCRVQGAKGTLALHPSGRRNEADEEPKVYLRPSQTKIKYDESMPFDDSMLIVDVLRPPSMQSPARLSTETITNLAENGVPTAVFINLMRQGMEEISKALTSWDEPKALYSLFADVAKLGGVMSARMARELGGESRARGYGERNDDDDQDDDDSEIGSVDVALREASVAWYADLISGQPSTLEETILNLLSSGFNPKACPVLLEKIEKVHETQLANFVTRYKITVPMSCSAMVIPDPCEPPVLKENEIHIKCSPKSGSFAGCASDDIVLGDVLVTRHPCKLPSDVQKMMAVDHPVLRDYKNVIVFPKVGRRSPASYLGGGDYDGDIVIAIWQPEIVQNFKSPSKEYVKPPEEVTNAFCKEKTTVAEVKTNCAENPEALVLELQKYLLLSVKDEGLVGFYSTMHETAIFVLGYNHAETIRLAHMFMTVMDGAKTGLRLQDAVRKQDSAKWGGRPKLPWKQTAEDFIDTSNSRSLTRIPKTTFILEDIRKEGRKIEGLLRQTFKDLKPKTIVLNEDLAAPFREYEEKARRAEADGFPIMWKELEQVKTHVERMWKKHRDKISLKKKSLQNSPSKRVAFTALSITERQDVLRELSREFVSVPLSEELIAMTEVDLRRVRASYAYIHDYEECKNSIAKFTRFPWDVATRELCTINAVQHKFEKTLTREFYDKMNVVGSFRTIKKK